MDDCYANLEKDGQEWFNCSNRIFLKTNNCVVIFLEAHLSWTFSIIAGISGITFMHGIATFIAKDR